jgi:zinc transport system ATP-binding protein
MDSIADRPETLVEVDGVTFDYGGPPVLLDVSLSIGAGDFLAVIGPNGSGKTTLLKIILGLLKPGRGRIRIFGTALEAFHHWEKIGYIPQKATHFDPLFPASVKEVVAMAVRPPRKFGAPRKEEESAIRQALDIVGMESMQNRRIGRLSGGQQQRVFIARAIVNRPQILFLDEPTTGVDAETQERFYALLGRLNKEIAMTIVLVTHDIGIVDRNVSRVACLNQSLVYHGSHDEFCRSEVLRDMLAEGHLISHRH